MMNSIAQLWGGGWGMVPLLLCSLVSWTVILERLWAYRALPARLRAFHLEASNFILRKDLAGLRSLCEERRVLPMAQILAVALDRIELKGGAPDHWITALERRRVWVNLELRRYLWILGTIGSSAPFIGLLGTVIGVLQSFQSMAQAGSGGFAVVAAGISEALVTTAAGIVVAVIAVMAYNALQVRYANLVLSLRLQTEELTEMLSAAILAPTERS